MSDVAKTGTETHVTPLSVHVSPLLINFHSFWHKYIFAHPVRHKTTCYFRIVISVYYEDKFLQWTSLQIEAQLLRANAALYKSNIVK